MKRVTAVLFAGALAVGSAAPAVAQTDEDPLCGSTFIGDVTLDRDLACDVAVGDNTRLDLGGHHIEGTVYMDTEASDDYFLHNVEIANGSVDAIYVNNAVLRIVDLETAVTIKLGDVEALRADASFHQAFLSGGGHVDFVDGTLRHVQHCGETCVPLQVTVTGSVVDLWNESVASFDITDSTIVDMDLEEGSDLTVRNSRVTGGINTDGSVHLVDNEFVGAWLYATRYMELVGNDFTGTSGGVRWSGDGATLDIRGNRFVGNDDAGLRLEVDEAPAGDGGEEGEDGGGEAGPAVVAGTISGNRFIRNGADGLSAALPEGSDVVVRDNVALDNEGYGMAVAGVIDGGGNVAQDNGGPEQCVGVVCAAK